MIIHKYDDEYATKNGTNGVKEFLIAIIVGAFGLIIPAVLLGIGTINFITSLIIWTAVIVILIYFIGKAGIIKKSSLSVLIENNGDLYYLMITPNFKGSMFPKSFISLLAGPSASFVENKDYAEMVAIEIAQNDEIVSALFDLYQKNEMKRTFDTVMYGKPIYVMKILDRNLESKFKKFYKVNCIKDNGKKGVVVIPNVYPTFFKNNEWNQL